MTATDSANAGFRYYNSFEEFKVAFEGSRNECRVNDIFETLSKDIMVFQLDRLKDAFTKDKDDPVVTKLDPKPILLEIVDLVYILSMV